MSVAVAAAVICMPGCQPSPAAKTAIIPKSDPLPFYNDAGFTAEWIDTKDARYAHIHTIDTFSLVNQSGHVITQDSLRGKIYAANFFFTSCTSICPKMTSNLSKVQKAFEDDDAVRLVSYSVTPWRDSVPVLASYAAAKDIKGGKWHLLTGSKEKIYSLARQSYFAEKTLGLQKSNDEFLHTESVLLIDKHARIRGIYNGTQPVDMERIIEDIRILKQEE